MEMNPDWIQIQIMYMFQCFHHNFLLKYQTEVIQMAVEIYFKILQFIVKYDFPNSDIYYA
jgi:hypothetical protein